MTMNSKRKGKNYELEVVNDLKKYGYENVNLVSLCVVLRLFYCSEHKKTAWNIALKLYCYSIKIKRTPLQNASLSLV